MVEISLDFETRSRCDLKKWGAWKYAEDPSTDVLCYAFSVSQAAPVKCYAGEIHPELLAAVQSGGVIRAWNAEFEWLIWNRVCVPKYGWPPLDWARMRDTMAQAAACNVPHSLGECAEFLGLTQQKDKRGVHLIQLLSKPIASGSKKGEFRNDPKLLAEMTEYCAQDVIVEREIASVLRPLSDYEQEVWVTTQRINERGLPVALHEIENAIAVVEAEKEYLNRELKAITGISAATQRDKVLNELKARGVDIEDLTSETIERVLGSDIPEEEKRILKIRALVCQTSTAKYEKMRGLVCEDGRIHGLLTYHGASTGRDASRGLNAQNLARPLLPDDDVINANESIGVHTWEFNRFLWGDDTMAAAVSALRGVITSPSGYDFIDADFSSIENRVAAWIAGQNDKLSLFAKGLDEYRVFATGMYGVKYDDVTADMRQVAKSAVLGCMFGQGWRGLIDFAAGYGVNLTEEQSQNIVATYRQQYHNVQATWYSCGEAALEAVNIPGKTVKIGKLAFKVKDGFLWMRLPSGRPIAWYGPEIEDCETPWGEKRRAVVAWQNDPRTRKFIRKPLIGSSIFQSAVQGTARDLLIHGVSNLERAGYSVVLRVHDEVLTLVPEGWGSEEEVGRLLCAAPDWASDIPLAFSSWRGKRYRK